MSEAELTLAIAELQEVVRCRCDEAYRDRGLKDPHCECDSAEAVKVVASRIKALTKERDEADDLAKAAFADGASNNIRLAETSYRVKWLEAKLAKAVEALESLIQQTHDCEKELTEDLYHVDFCGESEPLTKARATLAKIKGESHD